PLPSRRTFLALALTTVWPIETWPSPPITTEPPLRTVRMVVPCQRFVGSMRAPALGNIGLCGEATSRLQTRSMAVVAGLIRSRDCRGHDARDPLCQPPAAGFVEMGDIDEIRVVRLIEDVGRIVHRRSRVQRGPINGRVRLVIARIDGP